MTCAAEVGKSLACRGRCESDVRSLDEMLRRSIEVTNQPAFDDIATVSKAATSVIATADVFNVVLGTIFLVYAAYRPNNLFVAILGATFIAFGLFSFIRSRLALRKGRPSSAEPR